MTDAPRTPAPNLDMGEAQSGSNGWIAALIARLLRLAPGRWVIVLDTRHTRPTWAISEMGNVEHA